MKTEFQLIGFRFRQIYRALQHLGWGYVLLILPFLAIGLLFFLEKISQLEHPNSLLIGYVVIVLVAHTRRSDLKFLKKINLNKPVLFILEYSLLCLPFSLILLFMNDFPQVIMGHLGLIVLSIAIARFDYDGSFKSINWRLHFIPNELFEWKGSIRRYHVGFLMLWTLGLFMAMHELAYFIFVFMYAGIIAGTFKPTEGKELKPTSYLAFYKKIIQNNLFLCLLLSPHFVVYLIYNGEFWYILIGIIIYFFLYQCYCIFYKYANYVQYRAVNNDLPTVLFIFLCPLLPFSLVLLFKTFNRAKKTIHHA